jgi:hypothetical protein
MQQQNRLPGGRFLRALHILLLSILTTLLWSLASAHRLEEFTDADQEPRPRQFSPGVSRPWITLYGPLRLGVDPGDDNRTLSALGTWLRLEVEENEGRLDPSFEKLQRQALQRLAGKDDDLHKPAPPWPLPPHTSSATPPDILFFTDDSGRTCKILESALGLGASSQASDWHQMEMRVRCLTECVNPHHRRLDMSCLVRHATTIARTPVMTLVNSDIALGPDFVRTMHALFLRSSPPAGRSPGVRAGGGGNLPATRAEVTSNMLVVGRRTDLRLAAGRLDFEDDAWLHRLTSLAAQEGSLHGEYGIDYLVTARPGIWQQNEIFRNDKSGSRTDADSTVKMPPFLVGVYRWDSYVLTRAILSPSIVVVDATASVMALHLQGFAAGVQLEHRNRRGAVYNDRLVHDLMGTGFLRGHTNNADYELSAGGHLLPRL